MARRRSKVGMEKPRKIGTEELKRQKYTNMASGGHINAPRWGFSSKKYGKADICVFYAKFAAKKMLNEMISGNDVEWFDDQTLVTSEGVKIHGEKLKEIFNHKLTYNEERYHTLSEEHLKRCLIIRSEDQAKPFIVGESQKTRRRTSRKGMTLMKTIAEELGMTPREARGILRSKMKKPKHGWAWRTSKEVAYVKAILQGKSTNTINVDFTGVSNELASS